MLHRVDFSLDIWRWLFQPIYKRLEIGTLASSDSVNTVLPRMLALLRGEPSFILLLNCDDTDVTKITGHCLYQLNKLDEHRVQAFCEQLYTDSGHDTEFTKACISYAEVELSKVYPITEITFLTDESKYRAFKKKYEFQVRKVLMFKEIKVQDSVLN